MERYQREIESVESLVTRYQKNASSEMEGVFEYARQQLLEARSALARGDAEAAWAYLYGAATFCRSGIPPTQMALVLARIDALLS
jgi:hypothetical protein